jgi:hypothetical protein
MKARRTEDVDRGYRATTEAVRRAFDKQVRLLIEQGPEYHSLRVHPTAPTLCKPTSTNGLASR